MEEKEKRMRYRVLVIVAILILVIAAGLAGGHQFLPTVRSYVENEVLARITSTQIVSAGPLVASGFIEAEEILISTEMSGRIQTLYVDEGDSVSSGQVLVQLDTSVLDAQIQQAEAALRSAEAKLAEVKAGASPQEVAVAKAAVAIAEEGVASAEKAVEMAQGNVAVAQATLQAAQAELARLRAGPDPYEVALAETELEIAQQQLPVLWAVRNSTGGSEQRGEVPRGSYEAAKAAVAEAEIQIRILQLQLEDLKAGAHPKDLEAAQAAVEAAQAGVDAAEAQVVEAQQQLEAARARLREAQARLRLVRTGATEEEIAMAQAQVSDARAALQILKIKREKMTLRAPRDALVLERTINVGEMALAGSILLHLANLDRVKLTVYVPEVELGQVQLGQTVAVTVDSFPGRVFQGQVVYISSQAEFTPRNIQTTEQRASQVFAVRIELPNSDHALKPGMPADAIFVEP
jgi:multidrug efflux pump subunit AcrA (membrane-fusion protein)